MNVERALEILLVLVVIVFIIIIGFAVVDRIDNDPGLIVPRAFLETE